MSEQNLIPREGEEVKKPKSRINKLLMAYFITTIVIIAVVSVGFTMKANDFRKHGPFGVIMEKIIKDLDLTDAQKQEIEKIRDEVKAKMDEKKNDREKDMEEFGRLFKQDKLDKEQLKALANKHEANREEMKSFFMDQLIKVHAVLTPEQRTKAVEKLKELKEMHDKFGQGHEKHREDGSPDEHPKDKR